MSIQLMRLSKYTVLMVVVSLLSGCGYNTFQSSDEEIKAAWAEVLNQYQRRADLVPNLVNVVKGYAAHERADPSDRCPFSGGFDQRDTRFN